MQGLNFLLFQKSISIFLCGYIHDNFYCAGGDILLLQESYIHIDSILVHLSNWIFWSEILRRLVSVIVQCHIYSAACDHCGAF